ncbi:dynamin family protein [Romboutsia sp. Marseille-P6047]|uniref:dynamin family protein n=1 Tax=Romboutsia sp. Marseille-P6047 TaxID=2161817 RepID=UPI000F05C1CC|nr:dynamin family protein [Romboutsia sp. Marseille-P6047]
MKEIKESMYKIKEKLLQSPLRSILSEGDNIPFKSIVEGNLNDNIESIEILQNNESKPLNIVIVGEVKSGKSTFFNTLLKKDISEVDVLESTSSIIEASYGEKYENNFEDGIYKIKLNLDLLKKINIVDTPGLRSMTTKNENRTLSYIQNADIILFVIDGTHIGQEDIINSLDLIETLKKSIVGIVNKGDLLEDNKEEVLEYIQEEYGLYIDKFFLISSYKEYKNEDDETERSELNNNFYDLLKYIDELYNSSIDIKESSTENSLKGIIQREIITNYDYFKSITMLYEEVKKYEQMLRKKLDYITSKMNFEIDDWIDRLFFYDELEKIKENLEYAKDYINEGYINKCLNGRKEELDDLFFNEWDECLKEIQKEIDSNINKCVESIYYKDEFLNKSPYKMDKDDLNINEMLATVGTGALLGITSGGIVSVYSAAVGSSAASMTIGSALMMYCPPLFIAGTISGALGKIIYDKVRYENQNKSSLNEIEEFIKKLKENVKVDLKSNYYKCSEDIVLTSSDIFKKEKGINMNRYELDKFINQIEYYVEELKEYLIE